MTFRITKIVAASLLCSAAMIPSAMAQEAEAPAGTAGEVEAPAGAPAGGTGAVIEGATAGADALAGEEAGAECDELRVLVDENAGVIEQGWLDLAGGIVTQGDASTCGAWLDQAQLTLE